MYWIKKYVENCYINNNSAIEFINNDIKMEIANKIFELLKIDDKKFITQNNFVNNENVEITNYIAFKIIRKTFNTDKYKNANLNYMIGIDFIPTIQSDEPLEIPNKKNKIEIINRKVTLKERLQILFTGKIGD